ncbi:MAG: hypothetical protein KJS68_05015 [Alphaproteobacteria bacterium]|nr:hypothetical protein [Alphaproteobacteria bacterium]
MRIVLYVAASWLMAAHALCAGDLIVTALCLASSVFFGSMKLNTRHAGCDVCKR